MFFFFAEVDSKIYGELEQKDWNLLVAHYLGVDHAGHRYGPNHPEMTRKLNELNNRVQKIINTLPPDVILYVIGDHGMTETGLQSIFLLQYLCCYSISYKSHNVIFAYCRGGLETIILKTKINLSVIPCYYKKVKSMLNTCFIKLVLVLL